MAMQAAPASTQPASQPVDAVRAPHKPTLQNDLPAKITLEPFDLTTSSTGGYALPAAKPVTIHLAASNAVVDHVPALTEPLAIQSLAATIVETFKSAAALKP